MVAAGTTRSDRTPWHPASGTAISCWPSPLQDASTSGPKKAFFTSVEGGRLHRVLSGYDGCGVTAIDLVRTRHLAAGDGSVNFTQSTCATTLATLT